MGENRLIEKGSFLRLNFFLFTINKSKSMTFDWENVTHTYNITVWPVGIYRRLHNINLNMCKNTFTWPLISVQSPNSLSVSMRTVSFQAEEPVDLFFLRYLVMKMLNSWHIWCASRLCCSKVDLSWHECEANFSRDAVTYKVQKCK